MISNQHYIEIFVNNQQIELESQDSLNLRINNVIFNPTKTTTTQATYSYSFTIPSTPSNDKVFGYANNLAKVNKFHARYPAQVYADGHKIFDGSLTVQKYANKKYTCNLVNIKVNTLDEIFGDMKMTDLHWDIDFDGAPTINAANSGNTDYYFPMACYGMGQFQKKYVTKDEVGATYTSKHILDKYNLWWVDSFFPSLNVMATMKKAFESKGYTVAGSAFSDPNINSIYASCNLASEQVPIYNLGNPKFGSLTASVRWNNYKTTSSGSSRTGSTTFYSSNGGVDQELTFPYERINSGGRSTQVEYNFDTITHWNMFDTVNNSATTVTIGNSNYIYDPNEMMFVIPADGWYRIHMAIDMELSGEGTSFSATQWTNSFKDDEQMERTKTQMKRSLSSQQTPLEIQLVRNVDENIELIKGRCNIRYVNGKPSQDTYAYIQQNYTGASKPNKEVWYTDCPHQDPYGSISPTKTDNMINQATAARNGLLEEYGNGNEIATSYTVSSMAGTTRSGTGTNRHGRGATKYNTYGFMHKDGKVMPYDPCVSTAFICGFSSMGGDGTNPTGGTVSVMRDGYSWSRMSAVKNQVFCNVDGLELVNKVGNTNATETIQTDYCENEYKDCPQDNYCNVVGNRMTGVINCSVYLNKNDRLEVLAIQRAYEDGQMYGCSGTCELWIDAKSSKNKAALMADDTWGFYYQNDFPYYLNLFNFTNEETKVSDWINSINTAFNLEMLQEGNRIEINTNKGIKKNITYAVDIDDRTNADEIESEYISYPKEMSVKYKIDTDEYGFELTVDPEHIDDEGDEWKNWGDSGYTIIKLSDDTYETSTQNTQTNFSYTYYDSFLWKEVLSGGTESGTEKEIRIPVIEKAQYMADDYGYEEAMKHDGYSLTQRFWYRQPLSNEYVWLSDHMHEKVFLTYPKNNLDGFNLSYKDSETSIATEYFQIYPMLASNFVSANVYLTPEEYNAIKGGALVKLDSDLYYVSEISGYDCSGHNPTTLKLIKKV